MSSVRARSGRVWQKVAILGIALVASGLSIAGAPAAAADVTVCDGKGNCFTYRTLEPEVCKIEKIPEEDTTPVPSPPRVTGCSGGIAGGGNSLFRFLDSGGNPVVRVPDIGNSTVIGVPRCPFCGSEPTRPMLPPGF